MQPTEQQFNAYKKRLAEALIEDGLDADTIYNDTESKNYITKYVEDNLINKKDSLAIQGIVIKLAHMDVNVGTQAPKRYPIVNEYKGHYLEKTMYFSKTTEGAITAKTIPVVQSTIIVD